MTSETIICPIDLSEDSYIALAVASWFAKDLDARLHVLHVRRPDFPGGADASYREDDWFAELVREAPT
jgi:nucleotide-binding universal stress UspA family protein